MAKIYRDVYLRTGLPRFSGKELLYYTGRIVNNADKNGALSSFDRDLDIYLGCNCDAPRYRALVRKNDGPSQPQQKKVKSNKRDISYGKRKCRSCG